MSDTVVRFEVFNDPMFQQNGRVVYLQDDGPCWIIDPGPPPQAHQMIQFIEEHRLVPTAVVLTHAHADHIAGVDDVCRVFSDLPIYLAREEWGMLRDANENLSAMAGVPVAVVAEPVHDLPEGAVLDLGDTRWHVLDTSGHSPGGRSLYCAEQGVVLAGDALFAQGIGRYDFPHSDGRRLLRNIHEKLMTLPDETRVLSGHGPDTTVGTERRDNPFLTEPI
ncbi:MAG: MBL fold metallo-hydrolase [Planctomycetes bacterium]|nr:MBL fold metallo-hydrolase [Planctomycetota bacterium]